MNVNNFVHIVKSQHNETRSHGVKHHGHCANTWRINDTLLNNKQFTANIKKSFQNQMTKAVPKPVRYNEFSFFI